MRRLLPLVLMLVLICVACARRAEEPPAAESAPVIAVAQPPAPAPVPVVAADPAPDVAPRPALPEAPEPLPVSPGRTNGIGKRVVIDGLAVWVEAVEYKRVASRLKGGELIQGSKLLVISFGVQNTDPDRIFEYETWARYGGSMIARDARGRGWGKDGSTRGATHTGNVLFATLTPDKQVIDELIFQGEGIPNPPGSAEHFTPDFTAYFDIDLPRPTLPYDESRMYRFRVRPPEIN